MASVLIPGMSTSGGYIFTAKSTISSSNESVVWQVLAKIVLLTIQVKVLTAGSWKCEVTASPIEDVIADTADWFAVYDSDQSADRMTPILAGVTAVKFTRISGEHRVCVRMS